MKRITLLLLSILSLTILAPKSILHAEEDDISLHAAAYPCVSCGNTKVTWKKHYYTDWEDYTIDCDPCIHGKAGYKDIIQRKYYNYFLSCDNCGYSDGKGEVRYDQRIVCKKY